ncbi:hypothetical protein WKA22_001338 [Yersinia enterocolitica]
MTKWYLNELSLTGQFHSPELFIEKLKKILSIKDCYTNFFKKFHCPRGLPEVKVSGELTFRDAVVATQDKNFIRKVMLWLDRHGPFIEPNTDDDNDFICELNGKDVAESALSHVTKLVHFRNNAGLYSFENSVPDFSYSPVLIDYYFNNEVNNLEIDNIWGMENLEDNASKYEKNIKELFVYPDTWTGFLELINKNFKNVIFSDDIITTLNNQPFSSVACERGIFLANILNEYVGSRNTDGTYSDKTNTILRDYFSGGRALFTDESKSNKDIFNDEMTFEIGGSKVMCSWHGKISYRFFRMHFNYPIKNDEKLINVVYFGPKITKK